MENFNLLELLEYINPTTLNYNDWLSVGMALKHEGYAVSDWDTWSRKDGGRYHPGECENKWNGFLGNGEPVTGATITVLAKQNGWKPKRIENGHELDWGDRIQGELAVVDNTWLEGKEVTEPTSWKPEQQVIEYLETLFEAGENVGYVTESWDKDGKYLPTKGNWDRTAGQLIQELSKCNGDIGSVLGDYKPEAGAWIRFNPLDGNGCKNENVTDYRYALVESDTMDISAQNALVRELELPVAMLVHSGKKSLHAIVRVEAGDYKEYRKRVDYLYDVLKQNGMEVDTQNKNPSRLSRLPGVERNGHKQFIVDKNIGKSSWVEWQEWIESVNDDLPDIETLADVWDDMPELSPPLIDGVLRQGHKMLLAGPSKAGKSYALLELCASIAEGKPWLGFNCHSGQILYVNLELDRASCLHRLKDVYTALQWQPLHINNIDLWNLRGKSVPMDKLAPKLIRRATKKNYIAIIIDPIYKIITGDENSADQMANFCNQFDKVCTELGCAVIYCHHHSKGSQGAKRSMDRASGSGVFARDPDALLDLIELELPESVTEHMKRSAAAVGYFEALKAYRSNEAEELANGDDRCSEARMLTICEENFTPIELQKAKEYAKEKKAEAMQKSAWRIEGTLREFPKFEPVNLWFDYPIHKVDDSQILADVRTDEVKVPWQRNTKKSAAEKRKERVAEFENAIRNANFGEPPTKEQIADYLGNPRTGEALSEKTIDRRLKECDKYFYDKNDKTIKKKDGTDSKN